MSLSKPATAPEIAAVDDRLLQHPLEITLVSYRSQLIRWISESEWYGLSISLVRLQVIDRIFSFLLRPDLLKCRLINKKWNSTGTRLLRKSGGIELRYGRIIDALELLKSRNQADQEAGLDVDWYLDQDLKYSFEFGMAPPPTVKLQVKSALELMKRFGLACIQNQKIALRLCGPGEDEKVTATAFPQDEMMEIVGLLEQIIQGAGLDELDFNIFLDASYESGWVDPYQLTIWISRVVNSTRSIRALSLNCRTMGAFSSTSSGSFHLIEYPVVRVLRLIDDLEVNMLGTVELLKLELSPDYHVNLAVARPKLSNLRHLEIQLHDERSYPEYDWLHFRNFVRDSCPNLASCTIKLQNGNRLSLNYSFYRELDIRQSFPQINWKFVAHPKPTRRFA